MRYVWGGGGCRVCEWREEGMWFGSWKLWGSEKVSFKCRRWGNLWEGVEFWNIVVCKVFSFVKYRRLWSGIGCEMSSFVKRYRLWDSSIVHQTQHSSTKLKNRHFQNAESKRSKPRNEKWITKYAITKYRNKFHRIQWRQAQSPWRWTDDVTAAIYCLSLGSRIPQNFWPSKSTAFNLHQRIIMPARSEPAVTIFWLECIIRNKSCFFRKRLDEHKMLTK